MSDFISVNDAEGIAQMKAAYQEALAQPEVIEDSKPSATESYKTETGELQSETQNGVTNVKLKPLALRTRSEPMQRVYYLIVGGDEVYTPKEIARKLSISESSVRVYCKRLRGMDLVVSGKKGRYYPASETLRTHGYRTTKHIDSPFATNRMQVPLMQNLHFTKIQNSPYIPALDYELSLFDCTSSLSYGSERNTWSLTIQSDNGVQVSIIQLVIMWANSIISSTSVYPPESISSTETNQQGGLTVFSDWVVDSPPLLDWQVALAEFLVDVPMQFEGVDCLTWKVAEGWLLKAYRKMYGTRFEGRVANTGRASPFLNIIATLGGNLRLADELARLAEETHRNTEAIKFVNAGRNLS